MYVTFVTSRLFPCGKTQASAMAQAVLSDVYYTLVPKMKGRYLDKSARIKNQDPYTLKKADFCQDVSRLPTLRFAILVVEC